MLSPRKQWEKSLQYVKKMDCKGILLTESPLKTAKNSVYWLWRRHKLIKFHSEVHLFINLPMEHQIRKFWKGYYNITHIYVIFAYILWCHFNSKYSLSEFASIRILSISLSPPPTLHVYSSNSKLGISTQLQEKAIALFGLHNGEF